MKRIFAIILVVCLCISLCACDEEEKQEEKQTDTLEIKNVSLEVPIYWTEEGSKKGSLKYYAEEHSEGLTTYKSATLNIEFGEDDDPNYEVTFDGLYADNENMIKVLEKRYSGANVLSDKVYQTQHGVKGMLYHFSHNISVGLFGEEPAEGYCFCFASEADRRWYYITIMITQDATDHDYEKDYMDMIASIQCEGNAETE